MDPSSASSVPLALLGEQQAHKKRKKEPQYKEEDLAFVGMVLGDEAAGANPSTAKDEDDQAEEEEEDDDDDDGYGGDGGSGGGGAGEEEADRLYCLCRMPEDPNDPYMVQCDRCQEWYHLSCIGISMAAAKRMPEYICKECQLDIASGQANMFNLRPKTIRDRREQARRAMVRKRSNEISKQLKLKDVNPADMDEDDEPQGPKPPAEPLRPLGVDDGQWAKMQAEFMLQQLMSGAGPVPTPAQQPSAAKKRPSQSGDAHKKRAKPSTSASAAASAVAAAAAKAKAKAAGNPEAREETRKFIVQALKEALEIHWPPGSDTVETSPLQLADAIELAMFAEYAESSQGVRKVGQEYKAKYRSLLFNLRDAKNVKLRERVILGELVPSTLVKLTPDELANDELANWRAEEIRRIARESQMSRMMNKDGPIVMSTKKGEEIIQPATAPVIVPTTVPKEFVSVADIEPEPTAKHGTANGSSGDGGSIASGSSSFGPSVSSVSSASASSVSPFAVPDPALPSATTTTTTTTTTVAPTPTLTAVSRPITSFTHIIGDVDDAPKSFEEFEATSKSRRPSGAARGVLDKGRSSPSSSNNNSASHSLLPPVVFPGSIALEQLPEVRFNAHCIDGLATPDMGWPGIFGVTTTGEVHIVPQGRIDVAKANDYLGKIKASTSTAREIRVLRLTPPSASDEPAFLKVAQYYDQHQRFGVMKPAYGKVHPSVKDFYLVTVRKNGPLPVYISRSRFTHFTQLVDEQHLADRSLAGSQDLTLVLVIVRHNEGPSKHHHSRADATPEYGRGSPAQRTPQPQYSQTPPTYYATPLQQAPPPPPPPPPAAAAAAPPSVPSAPPTWAPPPPSQFAPAPWTSANQQQYSLAPWARQDFAPAAPVHPPPPPPVPPPPPAAAAAAAAAASYQPAPWTQR